MARRAASRPRWGPRTIPRRRAASWSLLGIFLGGFGVHRFLLGYTTIGIVQILVTLITCGFGAWWGIIEGIMVLAKSPTFERDARGRPLTD
ncbi:MAG: TM2 domain-containing protein [Brachybacterium tyrofermentans]|uniref:TM2 domain-containing protein n=1 Tax=Brachybacterium tyrofermentans TaxID=47848 RepID=UPI003FD023C1